MAPSNLPLPGMDSILDEDDARSEVAPLADAMGLSRQTLLDIILVAVVIACIALVFLLRWWHKMYHAEQRRRNPCQEEVRERERQAHLDIMNTSAPISLPLPGVAQVNKRVRGREVKGMATRAKLVSFVPLCQHGCQHANSPRRQLPPAYRDQD